MSENKFKNPLPPPEEQLPEVPPEAAPAETTEQPQEGQVEQAEEAPWTEMSPEETAEKLGDFTDIMEKQKEAILELRVNIAVEADEAKREILIDDLELLENEAEKWDSDFGPAIQEEEIVMKSRPKQKEEDNH